MQTFKKILHFLLSHENLGIHFFRRKRSIDRNGTRRRSFPESESAKVVVLLERPS